MAKLTKSRVLRALASLPEDQRTDALRRLSNGMLDGTLPDVDPVLLMEVGLALVTGKAPSRRHRVPAAPKPRRGIGSY